VIETTVKVTNNSC